MTDERAHPGRWSRGIEAIARGAWLLALLLVAGTALSRAHAADQLVRAETVARADVTPQSPRCGPWSVLEATLGRRVGLPNETSPTFLSASLDEAPKDVGGPEESEADATPDACAPTSLRASPAVKFPAPADAPLRTAVRGLYAARAPPRVA